MLRARESRTQVPVELADLPSHQHMIIDLISGAMAALSNAPIERRRGLARARSSASWRSRRTCGHRRVCRRSTWASRLARRSCSRCKSARGRSSRRCKRVRGVVCTRNKGGLYVHEVNNSTLQATVAPADHACATRRARSAFTPRCMSDLLPPFFKLCNDCG